MDIRVLQDAFVRELAVVVGALSASDATVADAAAPGGGQWTAMLTFAGSASGTFTVGLDEAGMLAVTQALLGDGEVPPEETISGTVRELLTQAAGAVQNGGEFPGLTIEVGTASFYEGLRFPEGTFSRAITAPVLTAALVVALDGMLDAAPAQPAASEPAPRPAARDDFDAGGPAMNDRIDVILDIDLPVVVRFGRTELPLRQLTRLSPGSVIDLGRSPDDPVELLVSDRVIARGEVVIVGGNYGVRILDVVSATERMRSMEV